MFIGVLWPPPLGPVLGAIFGVRKEILGATIVASRGGEMIAEVVLAMQSGLSIDAIAGTIHAYPTWSTDVQLAAVDILMERVTSGLSGRIVRWLSRLG